MKGLARVFKAVSVTVGFPLALILVCVLGVFALFGVGWLFCVALAWMIRT
jgi:hypothetical protein